MSENLPNNHIKDEIDVGQLFKLIGNAFDRFYRFIGNILNKLFLGFVWIVFFVKKHFLKFVIASVLGLGLGFLKEKVSNPVYTSMITVKQNYATGANLYDLIDYYNSLISQRDTIALKETLNLPSSKINSIINIEIEPTLGENSRIKEYNSYLKELDSTLATTIDYETFLKNKKDYAYTFQKIEIKSNDPSNISDVFVKVVEKINSTLYFQREQKKDLEQLKNREIAIKESLIVSDSLKKTYKKVLEKTLEAGKSTQTSITIEGADNMKETREFDLFQNDLLLRRELVDIERAKQDKESIIEIVSNEFNNGVVDDDFDVFGISISNKIIYSLMFLFLMFGGLLMIEFFKYLEKHKNTL